MTTHFTHESQVLAKKNTKDDKKEFLKILEAKEYNVKKACIAYKIERKTYYNWMKEDEWFAGKVRELRDGEIDDTEDLHRMHRKGVPNYKRNKKGEFITDKAGNKIIDGWLISPSERAATKFLEAHGRERGWGKYQKVEHDGALAVMPASVPLGLKVHKKGDKPPVKKKATPSKGSKDLSAKEAVKRLQKYKSVKGIDTFIKGDKRKGVVKAAENLKSKLK